MKKTTLLERAFEAIDGASRMDDVKEGLKECLKKIVNAEGAKIDWKVYLATKRTWEMKRDEEAQYLEGADENLSHLWDRVLIVLTECGIFSKKPENAYFVSSSDNPFSSAHDDFGEYLRSEFLSGELYFVSEQDAREYAKAYKDLINETYPWQGKLSVYKIDRLKDE